MFLKTKILSGVKSQQNQKKFSRAEFCWVMQLPVKLVLAAEGAECAHQEAGLYVSSQCRVLHDTHSRSPSIPDILHAETKRICCFSPWYNEIPEKINFMREGFIPAHSLRVQSVMAGEGMAAGM